MCSFMDDDYLGIVGGERNFPCDEWTKSVQLCALTCMIATLSLRPITAYSRGLVARGSCAVVEVRKAPVGIIGYGKVEVI